MVLPLQCRFCVWHASGTELLSHSLGELNQMGEKGSCYFTMLAACPSFVLLIKKQQQQQTVLQYFYGVRFPIGFPGRFFNAVVGPSYKIISPAFLNPILDQRIRKDQQEESSLPRTLIEKPNVYIPGFQPCQLSDGSNIIS